MASKVDKMVQRAIYLAGPGNLGYSQGDDRWNVWENGSADCASFNLSCAKYVGIPIGGATYTGNLMDELPKVGWKEIPLSKRHYGCLVCRPKTSTRGGHVAMMVSNNDDVAEALINEYGGIIGGRPGDQTGREVVVDKYNGFATRCIEPPAWCYEDEDVQPEPEPEPEPLRPDKEPDVMVNGNKMFRLYNPNDGNHMFTTSEAEKKVLVSKGWKDEGVAWDVDNNVIPVYRLFNNNNGDHMFTASYDECNTLIDGGWTYEGICDFASRSNSKGIPVYRYYNKDSGQHMFTTNKTEGDSLVKSGWKSEGVAWNTLIK